MATTRYRCSSNSSTRGTMGCRMRKGRCRPWATKYADRKTGLAMNTYPSISNPNFHELLQKMRELILRNYLHLRSTSCKKNQSATEASTVREGIYGPRHGYNGILPVHDVGLGKRARQWPAETYHATMSNPVIILTGSSSKVTVARWDSQRGKHSSYLVHATFVSCAGNVYDRVSSRVTGRIRKMLRMPCIPQSRRDMNLWLHWSSITSTVYPIDKRVHEGRTDPARIFGSRHHPRGSSFTIDAGCYRGQWRSHIYRNTSNVKIVLLTATPMFKRQRSSTFWTSCEERWSRRIECADFFRSGRRIDERRRSGRRMQRVYIICMRWWSCNVSTQLSPSTSTGKLCLQMA
jgi:hypothetical protein